MGRLIKGHGGVRDAPISLGWPLSTQRKTDRHEYCNTAAITSYCGLAKKKALCTPSLTAYVEPGAGERLEPGVDPTWGLWADSKQMGNYSGYRISRCGIWGRSSKKWETAD